MLADRFEFGESLGVVVVGFAFEVLELPRFGGGVGDLHRVTGGYRLIVNPAGVGARLDHDEAAGMLGEQLASASGLESRVRKAWWRVLRG